jgi:hypothetical protein
MATATRAVKNNEKTKVGKKATDASAAVGNGMELLDGTIPQSMPPEENSAANPFMAPGRRPGRLAIGNRAGTGDRSGGPDSWQLHPQLPPGSAP